jgi:hypothetical protein
MINLAHKIKEASKHVSIVGGTYQSLVAQLPMDKKEVHL